MELPRFIALKSTVNDKYLRYVNEDGPLHGFLQINGEELVTPFTKFEVVKAKCGDGLVNMRSCYNNKFWLKASPIFNWIVVGADEPEEDETKWSCTLFKPIIHSVHGGVITISFHHVQLDHSVFVERNGPSHDSCLLVAPTKPNDSYCDVYTIIDWDKMFTLPKYVAFKGDNGKYLRPQKIKGHEYREYLQFESEKLGDPRVGNAIFFNRHGDIKIQSDVLIGGGVWKRNYDDWILANSNFPIIPPFAPGPVIPDQPKIPFGPGPVLPNPIPGDLPFPHGPGPVIPDHPKIPSDLPFGPGPVIPDHPKIPGDLPFGPGPVIPDHPMIPGDLPFGPGPVLPIPIPIFPEDSLFWPEKVANNIVALQNLGNNKYCKRYTTNDFTSCLSAIDTYISEYSRIEVEELVTSRKITTVNFFLMDGRIYDHIDIIIATEEVVNKTNEPIIEDVKFSFPKTRSRCWNSSVSSKLYDLTTMKAGNPFVVDGKIEIPNEEFRGSYRWGETETSTTVVETTHKVSVPPMCKVKVTLTATKASCDVPFSYSQQDVRTNGHQVTQSMDDGIYTGINYSSFSYETQEENL